MALALALNVYNRGYPVSDRQFTVTASGNYATGGDTVDFTGATNPNSLPAAKAFSFGAIVGYSVDNLPAGYSAELIIGTALNNWKLKFYTASTVELANGAYPAGLTGATDIRISIQAKTNK